MKESPNILCIYSSELSTILAFGYNKFFKSRLLALNTSLKLQKLKDFYKL